MDNYDIPKYLSKHVKDIEVSQFDELKKNKGEFPDFMLDLVAFDCDFDWIVKFSHECGFHSLTEAKLLELIKENIDYIKKRRAEFMEARLGYLVEKSTDVIPELKKLYGEAYDVFTELKDNKMHKEAIGYLGNITTILSSIGKLQSVVTDAEKTMQVNVIAHGDFNLKIIKNFADQGAIQITDESLLRKQLGMSNSPAFFIEQFREI